LLSYKGLKASYQPGDEIELELGSHEEGLQVYTEVEANGKIKTSRWLTLNNKASLKFKIKEEDRGGVFVKLQYAIKNRVFSKVIKVNVPWSNKDLNIELSSIRNRIAPGAVEQWQVKISGNKKDAVSAEMLATMYDASLDQLAGKHRWNLQLYPDKYSQFQWTATGFGSRYLHHAKHARHKNLNPVLPSYPGLNWFGLKHALGMYERNYNRSVMLRGRATGGVNQDMEVDVVMEAESAMLDEVVVTGLGNKREKNALAAKAYGVEIADVAETDDQVSIQKPKEDKFENISPRTNLNETVFFFPDMKTDKDGNIIINFTMNEALTKWTFMSMAHTTDLEVGFEVRDITTFKNLMVFPNPPRFVRQGDQLEFSAKVQNMTDETLSADAKIELIDAVTEESLIDDFGVNSNQSQLSIAPQSSELLSWKLQIPEDFTGLVKYRILASDGAYSDGEENYLPALTNRMMVTETMPMNVKGNETKTFSFESFKYKSQSVSLTHENFAIEYTSNPAWYAIQSMPYLMEYPHDCSEQVFNRYFANALSSHVANAHPKIKQVFDTWKTVDKDALLSVIYLKTRN